MKYKIYAIKDTIIGEMANPFYQINDGQALRNVTNAVNDAQENQIKENYQDKQLYYLGEFDAATGEITSDVRFIVNLTDLKKGE